MNRLLVSLALVSTGLFAMAPAARHTDCCKMGKVPCCSEECCKMSDHCCKGLDHKDCAKDCAAAKPAPKA